MKIQHSALLLSLSLALSGCLDFGDDIATKTPTAEQVARCRSVMHLNPSSEIRPLGFHLLGSGIDDAIWFKFTTTDDNIADLFDSRVVDTSSFRDDFGFLTEKKSLTWWDANKVELFGGQVSLPNARFMNVGARKTDEGHIVYIMWHET